MKGRVVRMMTQVGFWGSSRSCPPAAGWPPRRAEQRPLRKAADFAQLVGDVVEEAAQLPEYREKKDDKES